MSGGDIPIPKPLRERLGIRAGAVLEKREEAGRLVATKTINERPGRDVLPQLKRVHTQTPVTAEQ